MIVSHSLRPRFRDRFGQFSRCLALGFVCSITVGWMGSAAQGQERPSEDGANTLEQTVLEQRHAEQQKKWQDILAPANARSLTIVVGTYEQRPFIFWEAEQTYGYGVELWNALATALDVKTEFVRYDNVTALLDGVKAGEVDIGVSGISITAAREGGGLDFSYPIYHGGLQLVVKRQKVSPVILIAQNLGGKQTLLAVIRLILLSLTAGALIWFVERKHNPDFPKTAISGIGQGVWFAIVTLGTFGYGDVTPRSLAGRVVAGVWMAFSFFVLGDFISTMTAIRQTRMEGTTLSKLQGKTLGATQNTSAYYFLRNQPVHLEGFSTFADAIHALREDKVVGVVGDYPTLRYLITQQPEFVLGGSILDHESYGLVTAEGNELLLEAVDRELLKLERSGQLQDMKDEWFGADR